jgi:hypothetical protein
VFWGLSEGAMYGPFFMETTITSIVYLDMLQQFLIPQLDEDDQEGCIHFQHDGAPPHYLEVREYLNTRFPGRWIDRAAPIAWPLPHLLGVTSLMVHVGYHLFNSPLCAPLLSPLTSSGSLYASAVVRTIQNLISGVSRP